MSHVNKVHRLAENPAGGLAYHFNLKKATSDSLWEQAVA
jgi:hypothetical protein